MHKFSLYMPRAERAWYNLPPSTIAFEAAVKKEINCYSFAVQIVLFQGCTNCYSEVPLAMNRTGNSHSSVFLTRCCGGEGGRGGVLWLFSNFDQERTR